MNIIDTTNQVEEIGTDISNLEQQVENLLKKSSVTANKGE